MSQHWLARAVGRSGRWMMAPVWTTVASRRAGQRATMSCGARDLKLYLAATVALYAGATLARPAPDERPAVAEATRARALGVPGLFEPSEPAATGEPSETGRASDNAEVPDLKPSAPGSSRGAPPLPTLLRTERKLEGSPVPLAPPARLGLDTARGRQVPLSLTLQQASLAAVLAAFAEFRGLNIVVDGKVSGKVSLRLRNVPWQRAFDTLLDLYGLALQRQGNLLWVAPAADMAARERARLEAHARRAELEPLASRSFELHYQRAGTVAKLLAGPGAKRVLSRRGTVSADGRTNRLFVADLAGRLAQVEALLAQIDRPVRQVLIEARLVEADESFGRNLGARLALDGGPVADARPGNVNADAQGGATAPQGRRSGDGSASPDIVGGIWSTLSAHPLAGMPSAAAALTLLGVAGTRRLALELSALEAQGRGRIVSSPRVVTADNVRALVEQGIELPYQAKVGNGVSAVQFRRAGLKLEVEPHITPDGHVVLDLEITKDSVGAETISGPAINTKHVRTRVQVQNGGTVSIGGIFTEDEHDNAARVPLLGRLPVLGGLFRNAAKSRRRSELLVFITPTVVAGPPPPAAAVATRVPDNGGLHERGSP